LLRVITQPLTSCPRSLTTPQSAHQQLYLSVDDTVPAEMSLYTNASIPVWDLLPGSYLDRGTWKYTQRRVNLANLGLEFVAKSRLVNSLPLAEFTNTDPAVWWLNQNSWVVGGLRDAMNSSIMLASERSASQATTVNQAALVVAVIGMAMLALVALGVIMPAVSAVFDANDTIFGLFLEVPLSVVRALRTVSFKKLVAIRRAQDESEGGIDVAGAGDLPEAGMAGVQRVVGTVDDDGALSTDDDGTAELRAALNALVNKAARERALVEAGYTVASRRVSRGGRSGVQVGLCGRCCACCTTRGSGLATSGAGLGVPATPTSLAAGAGDKDKRRYHRVGSMRCATLTRFLAPVALYLGFYVGNYFW